MAQQDQRHHSGGRSDYGRESGRRDRDPDFGQQGRRRWGRDEPRGGERWQTGEDRDRYQTGDERRYHSDWDDRGGERTYPGGRSYSGGGYPEEP